MDEITRLAAQAMRRFDGFSEAEWQAHDAEIQAENKEIEAKEMAAQRDSNRRVLISMDAPKRCLDLEVRPTRAITELAYEMMNHGPGGIYVLAGDVGTGKSVAACQWALGCKKPHYYQATQLSQRIRDKPWELPKFQEASAIVLDDVGTEQDAEKFLAALSELILHCHGQRKRLVMTMNLDKKTFKDRYKPRIVDRLREDHVWISLTGESMRKPQQREL